MKYQRYRTKPKDIAYGSYLYFLGLFYKNITAKALDRFVHKSHHLSIWKWIQRYKPQQKVCINQNKKEFYEHLFNIDGESYGLFRITIHPSHDPDEALEDQIEMIKYLKEKENYQFINYSDLLKM